MNDLSTVPLWQMIIVFVLVLTQGAWIFWNARSRDLGKAAWFWGIWGSISMPVPLLLYWLFVIRRDYRRN
ncbi:hypothetical protein [Paenibacillus dakarensis]|uniref:hypothetical protein n=1 Tax=Paenibacillus dakarensis TaxID=1527293 RepID=UPI0006D5A76E|nr:hypothetical protein [Paenibacillus dakarensis]